MIMLLIIKSYLINLTKKKTCKDKSKLRVLIIIFNITIINVINIKLKFIKLINKSNYCAYKHSRNVNALMNVNAFMNVVNVIAFINVNAFINMSQLNVTKI